MDSAAKDEVPAASLGKLDLQLTYLWRVHGIDYYAGRELADPMQFKLRLDGRRMLRGPRPEEGEQAAPAEGKAFSEWARSWHIPCILRISKL